MYILLSGEEPFYANSVSEVYDKIRNGKFDFYDEEWANISAEAKDLITKLLNINPKKRYTCQQSLQHEWLVK
jgi:serine/threonine protein kinase